MPNDFPDRFIEALCVIIPVSFMIALGTAFVAEAAGTAKPGSLGLGIGCLAFAVLTLSALFFIYLRHRDGEQ